MVASSKDNRFNEWIKCFELLFDATADQIMTDYNELVSLVKVTTTTVNYNNYKHYENDDYKPYYKNGIHYNWITLLPNRNQF